MVDHGRPRRDKNSRKELKGDTERKGVKDHDEDKELKGDEERKSGLKDKGGGLDEGE